MQRRYKIGLLLVGILAALLRIEIRAEAGSIYNSSYVTFAPDGRAWTTNANDQNVKWYRDDGSDDVITGVQAGIRQLAEGEHYYEIQRSGSIPVAKWKVALSRVNCCHMDYPGSDYHGIPYERNVCLRPHFSAWNPICADCGKKITEMHFYMSREAAASLAYLEVGTGMDYYYLCPFSHNLEQGSGVPAHKCKAISKNRYRVDYIPNADEEPYSGYMSPSFHFYDNTVWYEGSEVTPQTHLNKNTYQRIGWKFVGWNTMPDGTGDFYGDEAEIYNLCTDQYEPESGQGIVQLYAVWQRCSGQLDLLLEDCTYKDHRGVYSVIKAYGESYEPDMNSLLSPKGCTVSFYTGDGQQIPDIQGNLHFVEWVPVTTLAGKLEGSVYWFWGPDGSRDVIRPIFARDAIVLPKPEREEMSFGGWYYDETFSEYAGAGGDEYMPEKDTVLYARWVQLQLESADNYAEYDGSGAVDLTWRQPDEQDKVYQVFQSTDGKVWNRIYTTSDIRSIIQVNQSFAGDGEQHFYDVPYSGLYRISAYGAQGGAYKGFLGGYGGSAIGTFWLDKEERLTVRAGKQYGDSTGGKGNPYAGGGGYSVVQSTVRGLLLMAGGGGGAGESGDGLPGGSAQSLTVNGSRGESGGSGGGGGYQGGCAGELIVHHHLPGICNHVHQGDASSYGGCYTIPVSCGKTLEHILTGTTTWYWGGPDEDYCPNCGADASKGESCSGHETEHYKHVCPVHGIQSRNDDADTPSVCTVVACYAVGCGQTEAYICGHHENEIISSKPAYGGSSYVNRGIARFYSVEQGVQQGNGLIDIQAEEVGYHLNTELLGVKATDKEAPETIRSKDVERVMEDIDVIRVCWEKPEDIGTKYFHQVKSYAMDTFHNIGISNVTENILTSGVAGYYYCVDYDPSKDFNRQEFFFIEQPEVHVILTDEIQYLHVAPVDVAGNIGEITHVSLGTKQKGPEDVQWNLYTKPLRIEESEHVYQDLQESVYYVKCDGKTPFMLDFASYMDGPATERFQLNYSIIESIPEGEEFARNVVYSPSQNPIGEMLTINAGDLGFSTEGISRLQKGNYVTLQKENYGKNVNLRHAFVLGSDADHMRIELIPVAGAETETGTIYSDRKADEKNGIGLIGDGTAPDIYGLDRLEELHVLDRRKEQIQLRLTAEDALSGVREFYVQIENKDNGARRKIYPDGNGEICIDITEDIPVFSGDFSVSVTAIDQVGNENTVCYTTLEFDLQAEVERILEPHASAFQCGESGILKITTWGYAERVEVEFPEVMTQQDDSLNRVYVYDLKTAYKQEESFEFQVPLYIPENADYQVTVRAYKGNAMLEQHPAFAVIEVSGTVLNELRTRLR